MWNFILWVSGYLRKLFLESKGTTTEARTGAGSTNFVTMVGRGNTVRDNTMIVTNGVRPDVEYIRKIALHAFHERGGHRLLLVSNIGTENILKLKVLTQSVQHGALVEKAHSDFLDEKDDTVIAHPNRVDIINVNERKKVLNIPRSENGKVRIKISGVGAITGRHVGVERTFDNVDFDA